MVFEYVTNFIGSNCKLIPEFPEQNLVLKSKFISSFIIIIFLLDMQQPVTYFSEFKHKKHTVTECYFEMSFVRNCQTKLDS